MDSVRLCRAWWCRCGGGGGGSFIFFFNDTATTEIYTLSLHDALPISSVGMSVENDETAFFSNLKENDKCEMDIISG